MLAKVRAEISLPLAQREDLVSSTNNTGGDAGEDNLVQTTEASLASAVNFITESQKPSEEFMTSRSEGENTEKRGEGSIHSTHTPQESGNKSAPSGVDRPDDLESNHSRASADSKSEPSIIAKGPTAMEGSGNQTYCPKKDLHHTDEEHSSEDKDTSGEIAEVGEKAHQRKTDSGHNTDNEGHLNNNFFSDSSGADDANSTPAHPQGSVISAASFLPFPPTPPSEGGRRPRPRRLSTLFDSIVRPLSGASSMMESLTVHTKSPLHSK